MIGNNSIQLNQATMALAVQHYFDTVLFAAGKSPFVKMVIHTSGDGFHIEVRDITPENQKA